MTPELIAIFTFGIGLSGLMWRQGQRHDQRIDGLEELIGERFRSSENFCR